MTTVPATLTERTKRRLPRPTSKQMIAATEIIARANGESTADARSAALRPFTAGETLHDRLDRARLTEERLLGTIADGLGANRRDKADHDIRLKSTKLGLELRGLLQRGNRTNVNVGIGGNAQVAVALPWSPAPVLDDNSTLPSNSSITTTQRNNVTTTRSTIEGTGKAGAAPGHGHRTAKSARKVPVKTTIEERSRKNKNIKKRVGPRHQGRRKGGGCNSGRCGKCPECRRRAKLRIP